MRRLNPPDVSAVEVHDPDRAESGRHYRKGAPWLCRGHVEDSRADHQAEVAFGKVKAVVTTAAEPTAAQQGNRSRRPTEAASYFPWVTPRNDFPERRRDTNTAFDAASFSV